MGALKQVKEYEAQARKMRGQSLQKKQLLLWIIALILGGILGWLNISSLNNVFNTIATIYTHLFQLVAIPTIALAVTTTLSSLGAEKNTGRIFAHTITYTFLTTLCAAAIGLVFYLWLAPENLPLAVVANEAGNIPGKLMGSSYGDYLLNIIPANVLKPFIEGNVLSVLLISAAAGLGLAFMPRTENRASLLKTIFGLQELLFTLIKGLIFILPLGILAFAAQLSAQIEGGIIVGALGKYTAVIILGNLVQFFVIIPLFLMIRGLNPLKVFKQMAPAVAVALFTKSSAGTLPVTMASAENNLKANPMVARFVLPICTTINMNGCAAFILVTSLFLLQNAGYSLTMPMMITWLCIAVIAAVGNAGVPMGCYFLTLSLMSSMGVPVGIMGVILPIYSIIDMIETAENVWSDSAVCAMTNKDLQGKLPLATDSTKDNLALS